MLKKHSLSVKYAYEGMVWAFRTQANYRIHFFLSIVAVLASYFFQISYTEFLIIVLIIFIGIMVEALNTAIEQTTDAIDKQWREDIKIAKDVAAAAMLIFSFGALLIASLIFIPYMARAIH